MPSPSTMRSTVLRLVKRDPSTLPFIRAYAFGFLATSLPSLLALVAKLLVALLNGNTRTARAALRGVGKTLKRAADGRGFAMSCAVAIGGARWMQDVLQPVVRRLWPAGSTTTDEGATQKRERRIKATSTYLATLLSGLASIALLQSSTRLSPKTTPGQETIPVTAPSLYPALIRPEAVPSATASSSKLPRQESPTLDLTLFFLVRGTDVLVRALYDRTGVHSGKRGKVATFLAGQTDTIVFWLSCWRIMWCWFYLPERLPPSYVVWITRLARMDTGLLDLLKHARSGTWAYGLAPSPTVHALNERLAAGMKWEVDRFDPSKMERLDCRAVHGKMGTGSCEVNAGKRWLRAFEDSMFIYLPVHLIPPLIFNLASLRRAPFDFLLRVALAASRSSAFLATFVASIYASVCLVRTRLPAASASLLGIKIPQQPLDGGLCTLLGCAICGFSVLIENKRRRREMALYTAPRALYACMDEIVPNALRQGKTGLTVAKWIERFVFAHSLAVVTTATVYEPGLVSGVVRGLLSATLGKDWNGPVAASGKSKK